MPTSTSHVQIEAPRETVWAVVTQPGYVKQWQYGSNLDTDWSVGSPIRFRSEWDGQVFEQWGTVLQVDAPHRLQYSLFAPRPGLEDRPENYFITTYTLEDEDHPGRPPARVGRRADRHYGGEPSAGRAEAARRVRVRAPSGQTDLHLSGGQGQGPGKVAC